MRLILLHAAALSLLTGCAQGAGSNEAASEAGVGDRPSPAAGAADGIYIARTSRSESHSMMARFSGRFEAAGGCLVFRTPSETYLPVFGQNAAVSLNGTTLTLSDRAVELGRTYEIGGGERQGSASEMALLQPPPAGCGHRFLLVSGVRG